MASRRCAVCGEQFAPRAQVPKQSTCAAVECQRERKRRWQQAKLQSDPAYRENQSQANKAWAKKHPQYCRDYRAANPEYVERNRAQQRIRNSRRRKADIAKMDASAPQMSLTTGIYRLTVVTQDDIANKDAWIVEIAVIVAPQRIVVSDCK